MGKAWCVLLVFIVGALCGFLRLGDGSVAVAGLHHAASDGEGRGSGQIKRETDHCWRRYDGFNMNVVVGKKETLKKPFGILCNFKCTLWFMASFPNCEFIYDYKLSCYLFTSLPDCVSLKCTFLDYFS